MRSSQEARRRRRCCPPRLQGRASSAWGPPRLRQQQRARRCRLQREVQWSETAPRRCQRSGARRQQQRPPRRAPQSWHQRRREPRRQPPCGCLRWIPGRHPAPLLPQMLPLQPLLPATLVCRRRQQLRLTLPVPTGSSAVWRRSSPLQTRPCSPRRSARLLRRQRAMPCASCSAAASRAPHRASSCRCGCGAL